MTDRIYPQFATHNAHTVAAILSMATDRASFEFQRLHGMGEALHETVRQAEGTRCRIYAPVGAHSDLLAYLVRRLLENGANSSFVHQLTDEEVGRASPASVPSGRPPGAGGEPGTPAGGDVRGVARQFAGLGHHRSGARNHRRGAPGVRRSGPLAGCADDARPAAARLVVNPAGPDDRVGTVTTPRADRSKRRPIAVAARRAGRISRSPGGWRRQRTADLYEPVRSNSSLATREAGKTLSDGSR
jgi:RHH-type proline utilization regulon transcriptional repressor/proline dehydrogenase/delta 1-pyrroline-5-carboxylate dehydrogenase